MAVVISEQSALDLAIQVQGSLDDVLGLSEALGLAKLEQFPEAGQVIAGNVLAIDRDVVAGLEVLNARPASGELVAAAGPGDPLPCYPAIGCWIVGEMVIPLSTVEVGSDF